MVISLAVCVSAGVILLNIEQLGVVALAFFVSAAGAVGFLASLCSLVAVALDEINRR